MLPPRHKSPIPIRTGTNPPPSLFARILEHIDRRSVRTKSIAWGVSVGLVAFSLDYATAKLHIAWIHQRIVENVIEAVLFAVLASIVLTARDRRLRRRFNEVGYLNHHIRNSLTVIEMAEGHAPEANERLEMVKRASERIRRCVEKISREDDCKIDERHPDMP